jgi:hypothetical protein
MPQSPSGEDDITYLEKKYFTDNGTQIQGGSNMTGTNCDLFTHN